MVNQSLIDKATKLLREAAHPNKIILFGSSARNEAVEESDIDLLVGMPDMLFLPISLILI